MPNYDYKCKNCSYEFEEFQKMSDSVLITCPQCKTNNLVRMIHGGAGLHFKGSGFYLTDYKKSGTSSGAPAESVKKVEEKKTDTKSEVKTDVKTDESGSKKK